MLDRESWIPLLAFFGVVVVISIAVGGTCKGHGVCLDTVASRPCIPGTVEYDYEDGECECETRFGELEWEVGRGCDWDD